MATTKDLADTKTDIQSIKTNLQGIKILNIFYYRGCSNSKAFTTMTCIATSQGSAETKVKVGDLMAKLGGKI
jgi:hypothetical protein